MQCLQIVSSLLFLSIYFSYPYCVRFLSSFFFSVTASVIVSVTVISVILLLSLLLFLLFSSFSCSYLCYYIVIPRCLVSRSILNLSFFPPSIVSLFTCLLSTAVFSSFGSVVVLKGKNLDHALESGKAL